MPDATCSAWPVPPLSDPVASFPNAQGRGPVELREDERGHLWVEYPWEAKGERPTRRAEPLECGTNRENWGLTTARQCHRKDPRHPWNRGQPKPGYHFCNACGFPTWIEAHGVAYGQCERCGHHG